MLKLLVTRHGQTEWNVLKKVAGVTEVNLTNEGRSQAETLGKKLADSVEKIDLIVASPLKRATDTAGIISEKLGMSFSADERLREVNFGSFEGTYNKSPEFTAAKAQTAVKFPGGESQLFAAQRVYNFIDEMKKLHDGKTVLIVCHGGIARIINSYFKDMQNDEFASFGLKNCEVLSYEL